MLRKKGHSDIQNAAGFTMIELLVVILIIAILSGIVYRTINARGLQAKTRDAQRIQDLGVLHRAAELYRAANRTYPTDLYAELVPAYINVAPNDPVTDVPYYYQSANYNNAMYVLVAEMELTASADPSSCPSSLSDPLVLDGYLSNAENCYLITSETSSILPVVR